MFKAVLLSSAALALVATGAYASPKFTFSNDHRMVSVQPAKGAVNTPNHLRFPGGGGFSNLASDYPNGLYFCCYGYTISGPSSELGSSAYADAIAFTLTKKAKATKLSASANYVSGNGNFTLTLYADSGSNTPGAVLASGTGTSTTYFGDCCGTTDVTISSTKLAAGTQYWLGVSASGSNWGAWAMSTTDQVDDQLLAYSDNGGGSWNSYSTNLRPAGSVN